MLFKLHNELNMHKTVVTSEISTVIFYAMYLKKKVRFMNKIENQIISERSSDRIANIHDEYLDQLSSHIDFENRFIKKYPQIISDFLEPDIGFEISKLQLGYNSMLDKDELKKILGWKSKTKKILSFIISNYFDIKYGSKVRNGISE